MSLPKPYYEDDAVTLYLGDCREILPELAPESVDLVLTDPPYGVSYVTSWRSRSDPLRAAIEGDKDLNVIRDTLPLLDQLLKSDRHALLFAAPLRIGELTDELRQYWTVKNVLVWDKGEAGTVGDLEAGYGWNWEPVIYASKGRKKLNGPRPRTILRYPWSGTRDPVHPTVKPVGLLQTLVVRHSEPDDLVIDCFAGSGTTLAAAKNLGRRAVGIETHEPYAELTATRLAQEVLPLETA